MELQCCGQTNTDLCHRDLARSDCRKRKKVTLLKGCNDWLTLSFSIRETKRVIFENTTVKA